MAFNGRIALVTGASRGFGFAAARALGASGAQVIALARTVGGLEELDDAIRAAGGPTATLVPADVTDDDALARLGAAIFERWGRLDIMVAAAAHAAPLSPASQTEAKDYDRSQAVNARAVQRLIRVADPLFRAAEAPVAVFLDDDTPARFHTAYAASKAAQRVIVDAYAAETAKTALRVIRATLPNMATATRARFHPGEDRALLARPADVAGDLLAALEAGASGPLDLRA